MSETAPLPVASRKTKWLLLALVALCLAAGGGAYWYKAAANAAKQAANGKNRPLPVVVAEAKTQDVEVFLSSLGTVTPQSTVTVRSRVDGQLMQVLFREGQMVKAGDLLLVIDSRPFQVQLAQADGQLRRDRALLENARMDLKRYAELMAQGAIARQQYDTQQSLVHQYEGTVAADKATADSARLQITYSRITAPVSGQVGLRQVDPGNMVHASDANGLLVVNQIAPINVVFTLPEDQLPKVMDKLRTGEKLRVDAYDREQTKKLAQGELFSLDNQIDTSTGTVKLKATFANTKGELYPNQFVNAKLLLEVLKDAIVVPAAAVQRGQQGTYLYVVSPEGVANARNVSVGESGDGQSVILKGLALGEKVVVDGADRLRDGSPVEIKLPGGKKPEAGTQNATSQNATAQAPDQPADKAKGQSTGQMAGQPAAHQNATAQPGAASGATRGPVAKPEDRKAAPVAKSDAKPDAKADAKADAKTDAKAARKAQTPAAGTAAKTDATTSAHTNATTNVTAEHKAKAEQKPGQKPDHKPDKQPDAAPKQDVQAGSQPQARP
ncbi:MdtA/MuxA family multidrug efflux RND transporter periplasmic adaptor subunit [Humidesulfovibrio idahonensis]